jgi:biopolymer transport protein ExbD
MKLSMLSLLFIFSVSCSTTKCQDQMKDKLPLNSVSAEQTMSSPLAGAKVMSKVKVYKADGTLQCDQGKKITLEAMSKELTGITIYKSETKHDGLMRIQLCGKPTGQNNVYEINQSDLEKALALGFKKWIRD